MEKAECSFFFFSVFLAFFMMGTEVNGSHHHKGSFRKLFVFGDSYADTGNLGRLGRDLTRSWYEPYGMTFPKRPTGRYSDGRILPDYIASFLGIKSPIPFKYRRVGSKLLPYGMNFAVGGTGVFDTGNFQRNLSAQVDTFQAQIDEGVFSERDLKSSVALVSIAGNDYVHFYELGGDHIGIWDFIRNVTARLTLELKRIYELGVGKVVVTNLSPLSCTPYISRRQYNYTQCLDSMDLGVETHNKNLVKGVKELRRKNSSSAFLILDLHTAFMSIINQEKGARKFKNIFKPCCEGKEEESYCGQRDENGVKQYSLCCNPEDYFYWDAVHPSQAGWNAVFEAIRPWLRRHLG